MGAEPFHILLVENNTADVYLFRKALLGAGVDFDLTVVEDGGQAMAFIRGEGEYATSGIPDLAVLDLNLPMYDGIQILEAMRANRRFAKVSVVIASSSPVAPSRVKDERLKIDRYIMKPPDLDDFLQIGAILKEILLRTRTNGQGR